MCPQGKKKDVRTRGREGGAEGIDKILKPVHQERSKDRNFHAKFSCKIIINYSNSSRRYLNTI